MAVKQPTILSRADFDEAVVRLRLNVSDIAKATGIPRTYLSEFRNGDRRLRPEHLEKLRDYFAEKGVEFTPKPDDEPASPHPRLRVFKQVRCYFPVADDVPDEVVAGAMDQREEAEAELAALLREGVERNSGFLGNGDFTAEAKERLQEAFALLAKIGLLELYVRGFPALKLKPSSENVETVRDVIVSTFQQTLVDAGLIEPAAEPEKDAEAA